MAAPFYQHLNTMGLTNLWPAGMTTGPYPWSGSTHASQDYAIASIGQLKYLFSFRLDAMIDTDGDGLNDQAELDIGTNPFSADSDGDGIADGWEALWRAVMPLQIPIRTA
jgi:hypothetical protein